jgi:hypothetical protein
MLSTVNILAKENSILLHRLKEKKIFVLLVMITEFKPKDSIPSALIKLIEKDVQDIWLAIKLSKYIEPLEMMLKGVIALNVQFFITKSFNCRWKLMLFSIAKPEQFMIDIDSNEKDGISSEVENILKIKYFLMVGSSELLIEKFLIVILIKNLVSNKANSG